MELNREQIIKALECCQTQYDRNCNECPYERHKTRSISVISCESTLRKDLLSLIKDLTEENERLREQNERYAELEEGCYVTGYKNIKADTVREMQERLKECFDNEIEHMSIYTESQVLFVIDQIAKEMLEGNNENNN